MPKTAQPADINPIDRGIESIMMQVKNVASGLVLMHGGFYPDAPSDPYCIKIGSFVVRAKDTDILVEKVAEELLRRMAKGLTTKQEMARWKAEIEESRRLFPSASLHLSSPLHRLRAETNETSLLK